MSTRRVVVQAPDERGLRAVDIDGVPAGAAWSRRDLRRLLRRAGLPRDVDLEDRASITWRGADSATWPDRAARRRVTIALLAAGLVASMLLLARVGTVDALGALTFSGRLTGVLLVLSGAVQGVAAVAVLDYWGKRTLTYAGPLVLVGVLIAVGTEALLLIVWFQEREWTPYLPVFLALSLWSLWAGWVVWRERAWKGIPHPKSFTAGVVATALLASANFAYSALYQPQAALFHFVVEVKFGTPRTDPKRPLVYLPVKFRVANDGAVPAHIVNSIYWIKGRESVFDAGKTELDTAQQRVDAESRTNTEPRVRPTAYRTIDTGTVVQPGAWIGPGADFNMERVVAIPTDAPFDLVIPRMAVTFLRGDRGKIGYEYGIPIYSWKQERDRFFDCSATPCTDYVMYHARVRHNNNIINVTRRPRYLSSYLPLGPAGLPVSQISPLDSQGRLSADTESSGRYGVDEYWSPRTEIPFATLLEPARS
ncbi:hypothetical protein ACLF6K_38830 (plasmid) [Streptomyces xanthophaeus]|uniref:hypothetical protein n=1 Tax=Streptomyces xanthophaeus TaxID=67385 RepID=UPI00398FE813